MKKVLVTGGAGFVGYHLAKALAEAGDEVVVIDNFRRGRKDDDFEALLRHPNVKLITADLTDQRAVELVPAGFDEIYHLAAINGTKFFYEIPVEVFRANMLSTINLLEWMRTKNPGGRFLFTSSSEGYAGAVSLGLAPVPTPEEVPLVVEDPKNVRWSYGAPKIAGEVLLHAYVKEYGLNARVVRYHNIYGPRMGEEHVLPQFIRRALAKTDPFPIYGGEETRAFCYVEDGARGTIAAMRQGRAGETYHIGTRDERKIRDVAGALFNVMNFHPTLDVKPAPEGSVKRRAPDITKAEREIGYRPTVALDDGLRRMSEWYAAHSPPSLEKRGLG